MFGHRSSCDHINKHENKKVEIGHPVVLQRPLATMPLAKAGSETFRDLFIRNSSFLYFSWFLLISDVNLIQFFPVSVENIYLWHLKVLDICITINYTVTQELNEFPNVWY